MHLKPGTLLQESKYKILRFIKSGGFGCTYEAEHTVFGERVAIKEFFPKDFCNRDEDSLHVTVGTQSKTALVAKLKRKFIEEAVALRRLSHPGIVKVADVFEENGTAYYVMDYIDGCSLDDIVKRGGAIPEAKALRYIRQVGVALDYVHSKNRLHLDIKPGNLMVDAEERVILIDFGASKQYDQANGENTSTIIGMTPGYAPLEQYKRGGLSDFSPATDIYSLGATLYKMLTGKTPPEALDVYENGLPSFSTFVSSQVRSALVKAMSPKRTGRFQSVMEFMCHLPDMENESQEHMTVAYYEDGMLILNDVEYQLAFVKTGWFKRKSEKNDEAENKIEMGHFWMGCNLLTQDIWETVMGYNPSRFKGPRRPVENVSWDDCQEFIMKLNELTGGYFRLPSEAEWEFAARGGAVSLGYCRSGSDSAGYVSWNSVNSGGMTHEVGRKSPNELGIYDMNGNVSEWCSDWYAPYDDDRKFNPSGPVSGVRRVHRGGGWRTDPAYCSVSDRFSCLPRERYADIGFRLCADVSYPESSDPMAKFEEDDSRS